MVSGGFLLSCMMIHHGFYSVWGKKPIKPKTENRNFHFSVFSVSVFFGSKVEKARTEIFETENRKPKKTETEKNSGFSGFSYFGFCSMMVFKLPKNLQKKKLNTGIQKNWIFQLFLLKKVQKNSKVSRRVGLASPTVILEWWRCANSWPGAICFKPVVKTNDLFWPPVLIPKPSNRNFWNRKPK